MANGWHIAQAIPVFVSVTFSFFCMASSPWNRRSPTRTCSMNTSSKAFSCCGVCFCLWASASENSVKTMAEPSATSAYRVFFMAFPSRYL